MAALTCAFVSGAAAASDASAVATAPARTAALTVDLVDMSHVSGWFAQRAFLERAIGSSSRMIAVLHLPAHNFVIGKGYGLSELLPAT
jgi:hypothetical protein